MIFIYDGLRNPGNMGTILRNVNVTFDKSNIRQIAVKPTKNLTHYPSKNGIFSRILEFIFYFLDQLFNRTTLASINESYFYSDGSYSGAFKRRVKKSSCQTRIRFISNIEYNDNVSEIIRFLTENNIRVYTLENDGNAKSLYSIDPTLEWSDSDNICFIFGSELEGTRKEFRDISYKTIKIPTRDDFSYNVSIAHGIVCSYINSGNC